MSTLRPMVTRWEGAKFYPITITDAGGSSVMLSWTEAARVMGELQQELEDHDREVMAQRELESRAEQMIATTATTPPVPTP